MRFEYDDCLKQDGAGSDRGWIRLADPSDHPQWSELTERYRDWVLHSHPGSLNIGNWLDYEHGPSHEPMGTAPTIHACAYLCRFYPNGMSHQNLSHGWFWGIDEAKAWIEQTVTEHLDRIGAPACL